MFPYWIKHLTGLVVFGIAVGTALYDLLAYVFGGDEATISKIFLSLSQINPFWMLIVAYISGLLTGHFFLPQTV